MTYIIFKKTDAINLLFRKVMSRTMNHTALEREKNVIALMTVVHDND